MHEAIEFRPNSGYRLQRHNGEPSISGGAGPYRADSSIYEDLEIRCNHPAEQQFDDLVFSSAAMRQVLKQVEIVSPTDCTVLIQGETGTGKELIARAIHNRSLRRERTLVKVNCAAIPTGLLESELFGHEKGAFTGAAAQRVGRFELANRGTLFLDEIGDIPQELQPKLLRILQEQEFERLGSTRTIRTDVRLVAATHRNLGEMVEDHQFRADLYYRFHVFPITVPPLRERREDIPLLVRHFVEKCTRRTGKRIETVPAKMIEALMGYQWPGNIRELQNFVERCVILSPGPVLHAPLSELSKTVARPAARATTLEGMAREHILSILRESNWVVGGLNGAATRLGLPRTTLIYKMRRLGIRLERIARTGDASFG